MLSPWANGGGGGGEGVGWEGMEGVGGEGGSNSAIFTSATLKEMNLILFFFGE